MAAGMGWRCLGLPKYCNTGTSICTRVEKLVLCSTAFLYSAPVLGLARAASAVYVAADHGRAAVLAHAKAEVDAAVPGSAGGAHVHAIAIRVLLQAEEDVDAVSAHQKA